MDELRNIKRKRQDLNWATVFTVSAEEMISRVEQADIPTVIDYLKYQLKLKYHGNPLVPFYTDIRQDRSFPQVRIVTPENRSEYKIQMMTFNSEEFELLYGGPIDW